MSIYIQDVLILLPGQEPGNFHVIIVNDNLDKAYSELRDFISQNLNTKEAGKFEYEIIGSD